MGWAEEKEMALPEDADFAKQEQEFYDIKNAIEQIMEYKVVQRRSVQAAFGWDIAQLLLYTCFLILFSVNNVYNPKTYPLYKTKSMIETAMLNGRKPLNSVNGIDEIYLFLADTIVPSVAAANVTNIDHRCTANGRHSNPVCLQDPFANEALCCYTKQPNKGIFSPGTHTKNILVQPVTLRQQRVRAQTATNSPLGTSIERWPALTSGNEETRDGGGTTLDFDPDGVFIDWPSSAPW